MPQKPIFATPQDAEAAFYDALEKADLEAMMAIWAEDEEIVCVLPGGARLTGYAAIREAWHRLFEAGKRLQVRTSHHAQVQNPFTAIHSVIEQIGLAGERGLRAPVAATNVFVRGALGWRLVLHHASPVPPDSLGDGPKTIH